MEIILHFLFLILYFQDLKHLIPLYQHLKEYLLSFIHFKIQESNQLILVQIKNYLTDSLTIPSIIFN
jgi:hypothetical protein